MIKISITDRMEYSRLRRGFLSMVSKYVAFDEEDILPDTDKKEKKRAGRGKTKSTAEELKNNFPALYEYLFETESGGLKKERLRFLLAGPDEMPQSFGGEGGRETMRECLEEVRSEVERKRGMEDEETKKAVRKCCREIFSYQKFVKQQKDAHKLLNDLNVRVCPYCNRIYTVSLPSPDELRKGEKFKATRATFDHFYSQSQFPYLGLSLFNLVPSCYTCNLNKADDAAAIIYPYDEGYEKDVVFRIIPDLSDEADMEPGFPLSFLHGESDRFFIKFMGRDGISLQSDIQIEDRLAGIADKERRDRIIKSVDVFKLEELYGEHREEIRDILRNRYYFDDSYVKTVICPLIRQKMKREEREIADEDVEKMAMDMLFFSRIRLEEWGKRPLAKLTADILDQLSD